MGGDYAKWNVSIDTVDNFHRVYTTTPHHLPQINNSCPYNGPRPCQLETLTVSQNDYSDLRDLDLGLDQQAAIEHKAKLVSR
jgi:hypothetical protein